MTKVFLWMTRIAEGWISSFINCFQYFFWCICSQWFLIGSSQIKMTRFLIVSYTTRIQWQLFIPPSFISSEPLDRWSTCLLRQILFLLREDRIKNPNLMNLQGKGLSYLSPEVLYFWQIWNQRISELIMSHDYVIMNLQGDCPQYLGDISLYEEWTGVSLKISENENHVINAIYLKNQDITPWKSLTQVLTRESCKKGNLMTEPHNPQRKQMEEKLDGCARCDDSFLQTFRDYDNSQECKGEDLCRYTNCRKHLVIKSTVKHSHVVHAVWHAFGCNNSGMGFTDDARVHHSAHTGGKSYKHHLYGRDFSQSSERTVHDKTHSGEKTSEGQEWAQGCRQNSDLPRNPSGPPGDKSYKCMECGKGFSCNSSLHNHRWVHTGEMPYTCDVCGKGFGFGSLLCIRQRVHSGKRLHKCTECGKDFDQGSNLLVHQKVHTGEKPYKCSKCGKCFGSSSDFQVHQKLHMGDKPYRCDECGKRFSQSTHLHIH